MAHIYNLVLLLLLLGLLLLHLIVRVGACGADMLGGGAVVRAHIVILGRD